MKNSQQLLTFILLMSFSGCASLSPFIQNANIVPLSEEKDLGAKMAIEISKSMAIVQVTTQLNRVQTIGNRLVNSLPQKDYDYQFRVVQDKTPNAFTIPGGTIYVHTGLLNISDDAELAGVLGHEIGHAFRRHPAKTLTREYGLEYLSKLFFKGNPSQIKGLVLQLAKTGILNKYGRDDEREADEVSYYLLQKAELPRDGLLRFLEKLQSIEGQSGAPFAFLRTHPPTQERIARLKILAERSSVTPPFLS